MNGRRIYHARGKVLGGSSSINGMIFQRGNPLDYERWGADPGMDDWDFAHCLPYFNRMENCLAADRDDPYRGHDGPLVLERGPATQSAVRGLLRRGRAGRLPADRRRQRLPAGGFRALRPQHPQRAPAVGRPRLPAPGDAAPQPERDDQGVRRAGSSSRASARSASTTGTAAAPNASAPARSSSAAARSTARSCCSSPASATPLSCRRSASTSCTTCRASARTCRTTWRSTSSTPASSRSPCSPYLKWRHRPFIGAQWLFLRRGPGATNHFEGGGFVRSNDDVAYPNLMFHFLPIAVRYDGSLARRAAHGYQVHVGPMYSDARGTLKITQPRPERAPGAAVQLPVHRAGPPRVGGGHPGGPRHPQPAGDGTVQRRRDLARALRSRPTRRSWTGWQRDAETALHPSCTAKMGTDADVASSTRRPCGCTASRACGSSTPRSCRT